MTDYSDRVPDIAEREEAARLLVAFCEAEERSANTAFGEYDAPTSEKLAAVHAEFSSAVAAATNVRDAAIDEILKDDGAASLHMAAKKAAADALARYNEHPIELEEDDYCQPLLCALSGIPITTSDRTVTIDATGKTVLAAVLGLPDELFDDDDDDAFEPDTDEQSEADGHSV